MSLFKYKFVIILLLCFVEHAYSQNEANIWYFGENAGLDFNSSTPTPLLDGALNTLEGCSTISNESGQLLFYTDGSTVWNRNHIAMPNGTGLNGDSSSTQSGIIVPKPNNSNIYYIFTVDDAGGPDGLQYSEVDMTLNSGLGDVTSTKNILLETPVTEKISAVKKPITNEFWVVSHKWNSDEFIAFNISELGVDTNAVVSAVGPFFGGSTTAPANGQLKISPDGSKIAMANGGSTSTLQLFNFDIISGQVNNPLELFSFTGVISTQSLYGVEFSPNNELLYASVVSGDIYQFNLSAGSTNDITNSRTVINTSAGSFGALQLGSDGKIYIANFNGEYLSIIEEPDEIDLASSFILDGVYLGGRLSKLGLPPFIQSFFNVGFQFQNLCLGNEVQFISNISVPYDSLEWNFGDGTTSTDENPTHIFNSQGSYYVTLSVSSGLDTVVETQEVIINIQPIAFQPQNIFICDDNNDGFYSFNLTLQDTDILNGQDANQFLVDYYASATDYASNIPIADYTSYINTTAFGTQEITVSVRNNENLECEAVTTFNIQVFENPVPSQMIQPLSICDNTSFGTDTDGIAIIDLTERELDILNGQSATDFTVLYYTDVAFTNEILTPSSYQNTNLNETIYILVENNNAFSNCVADTSFQLEVFPIPTVTALVSLSQCDDNTDGFSIFNLTEVNAELSANYLNEMITFYENLADAEADNNEITNQTTYTNQTVSTDTVWARIESSQECFRTAEVVLVVSTTEIPNTFLREFYACDDEIDTQDGVGTFDFSAADTDIRALFPVGQQLIINYYRNQADALSEANSITDISNYRNIGYQNTQEIYVRVDSDLDNDCLGLGHHITLNVETVPIANQVTIAEQCDADGDGLYPFDTTTIETDILQGQTNVTVTYTDAIGNPLPSPLPNPFLSGTQDITVRVTSDTSQDPNGACFAETTLNFVVQAAAVANAIQDQRVCDNDTDGFFSFDTSTIEATLLNGQTGMVVSYTNDNGNPLPSPLPNPFFSDTQTITARVENILSNTCFDETTINFIVDEVPVANTILDDFVCDDASNDGEEVFVLSDYDSQVLNGQSDTTFEVFYFDNPTDVMDVNATPLPNNYLVNNVSTILFARIQNRNNQNCFDTISFQLGVNVLPIAAAPTNFDVCDDASNDGEESFMLNDKDTEILNSLNQNNFNVKYYLSLSDAEQDNNQLSNSFTNTQNPQTIYVRLENNAPNASECFTTTQFDIYVREQPVLLMDELWPICEGTSIDIEADAGYDNYLWSNGEMTRIITVDEPQTLTVKAWNEYGNLICETPEKTITVTQSSIAEIIGIIPEDWTQSDNSITVNVMGPGDYEYSIDGFVYQDSNIFTNLLLGEYIVYVRDKLGCGNVEETVYLLGYPRFFTPNGDGNNDYWQIIGGFTEPGNVIRIFDRYGKLLKQISPTDSGWDGTYNGKIMPTSDYWFVVERQNGRVYTGHFTLKR